MCRQEEVSLQDLVSHLPNATIEERLPGIKYVSFGYWHYKCEIRYKIDTKKCTFILVTLDDHNEIDDEIILASDKTIEQMITFVDLLLN